MTPLPEIRIMSGCVAACLAPQIWTAMGARERRIMLWDLAPERRAGLFPDALRAASVAGLAWERGALCGLAWIVPLSPGSRCGLIHFCFLRRAGAEAVARRFLDSVRRSGRFDSLLAVLPVVYRHARSFALGLGFADLGALPGACWLAAQSRAVDGVLLRLVWGQA